MMIPEGLIKNRDLNTYFNIIKGGKNMSTISLKKNVASIVLEKRN